MNEFLNKIFINDTFDEDEQKTIKNNLLNTFYADKNINDVELVDIYGTVGIFKYKNLFLYYDIDVEKWRTMCSEVLNYDNKDNCKLVKLMENSSKNIEFILYPFFAEEDDDVFNLNAEHIVDITNSKITNNIINNVDYTIVVDWKDGIQLYINIINNTYILKKDGEFISGFTDKETHFQMGDSCTMSYILDNGDLMIENCGDVCSVVIIRLIKY